MEKTDDVCCMVRTAVCMSYSSTQRCVAAVETKREFPSKKASAFSPLAAGKKLAGETMGKRRLAEGGWALATDRADEEHVEGKEGRGGQYVRCPSLNQRTKGGGLPGGSCRD